VRGCQHNSGAFYYIKGEFMGGFTQFPNHVLDEIMPKLSPNGWKLFCLIWRKTAGWNKTDDHISYSQIMDATGIKNKTTVRSAIKELSDLIKVDSGNGRSSWNKFDVSDIINGTDFSLNGTEIVPFNQINGTDFSLNGTVFSLNGTEISTTKDNNTKDTNTKDKRGGRKLPKPGPVTNALLSICKQDYEFVSNDRALKAALLKTTDLLKRVGATAEQVEEFEQWRTANHWTGSTAPTLKQVGEFWGQYTAWVADGKPSSKPNGKPNGQPSIDQQAPTPGKYKPVANFTL